MGSCVLSHPCGPQLAHLGDAAAIPSPALEISHTSTLTSQDMCTIPCPDTYGGTKLRQVLHLSLSSPSWSLLLPTWTCP